MRELEREFIEAFLADDSCCVYCGEDLVRLIRVELRICPECGQDYRRDKIVNQGAARRLRFMEDGDVFSVVCKIDFWKPKGKEPEEVPGK